MQDFLRSLHPTLNIKQWVYEEQKKRTSRYRPTGKVVLEKIKAQLVQISGKTPNSRKAPNALKSAEPVEEEGSMINAINSEYLSLLTAADHTPSPGSLSGDSSCGSIR